MLILLRTSISLILKFIPMKRTLIFLSMLFLLGSTQFATAQEEASQSKVSHNLINEYGFFIGSDGGFTGVFINSIKFNKSNDLIGIGIGYEASTLAGQAIPLFFNYRHYFDRGRKLMPLFNIAVGTHYYFGYDNFHYDYSGNTIVEPRGFGLYGTIGSGFIVKA